MKLQFAIFLLLLFSNIVECWIVDYQVRPPCGNKPMFYRHICHCGNKTLSGESDLRDGDTYCCSTSECTGEAYSPDGVTCEKGHVKQKTQSCNQKCWNPYRYSEKLFTTATLYCQDDDYCQPIDLMCSGVCREDAELCNDKLRCKGDGYETSVEDDLLYDGHVNNYGFKVKSLNTKLGMDHYYCLKINNDQVYDTIGRQDEEKILGTHESAVTYTGLEKCHDYYRGADGIQCSNGCKNQWCSGTGDTCNTTNGIVSMDNPELCRNSTFWRKNNFSCEYSIGTTNGIPDVVGIGERCNSLYKHCFWPWYLYYSGYPSYESVPITCIDKSDQVFPINTTCWQYNTKFLETYRTIWCTGKNDGFHCNDLEEWWYSEQEVDHRTRDPHSCELSCLDTSVGADCLACEHPDFFHCVSTGFCINKDLVCDGHPHPK